MKTREIRITVEYDSENSCSYLQLEVDKDTHQLIEEDPDFNLIDMFGLMLQMIAMKEPNDVTGIPGIVVCSKAMPDDVNRMNPPGEKIVRINFVSGIMKKVFPTKD